MIEEQLKQETLGWLADIGEPVAVPSKTVATAFGEIIGRIQQTIAAQTSANVLVDRAALNDPDQIVECECGRGVSLDIGWLKDDSAETEIVASLLRQLSLTCFMQLLAVKTFPGELAPPGALAMNRRVIC